MRRAAREPALVGLLAGLTGAVLGGSVIAAADRPGDAGNPPQVAVVQRQAPVPGFASTAAGSEGIPAIAAAVLPSVVTIESRGGGSEGTGSGVVLDAQGYILTNAHVVADAATDAAHGSVRVIAEGGTEAASIPARIVGTDTLTDLAVIRTAPSPALRPAVLGHSNQLRIGQTVLAVGAPLGLDGTVTEGIVSATNRFFTVGGDRCDAGTDYTGAIQTDAAINPGNSGGALVDTQGDVVGINAAIATASGSSNADSGNIGVGFAIPIDEAAPTAAEIIRTGRATHPFLGVSTMDSGNPVGAKVASTQDPCSGDHVAGVQPGSPAARAGLRDGDVITALAGHELGGTDDLVTQIRLLRVGDKVGVTFVRAGVTRTVGVVLTERPRSAG